MPARNPFAEYTNNKIMTASPAEITLMLYEGAIKFCNIAIIAIENGEIEKAHVNIKKTQRIIEEFRNTLDRQYKVAEDFDRIYVYLLRRLLEANIKKDKERHFIFIKGKITKKNSFLTSMLLMQGQPHS